MAVVLAVVVWRGPFRSTLVDAEVTVDADVSSAQSTSTETTAVTEPSTTTTAPPGPPKDQRLDASALPDVAFGPEPVQLDDVATSGLPVEYSASGACSWQGGVLVLVELGTCTVTAGQSGNESWNPATPVERSFEVTVGTQTVELASRQVEWETDLAVALDGVASSRLVVEYRSFDCRIEDGFLKPRGLTTCTVTALQRDPRYEPAEVDATFEIVPGSVRYEWSVPPDGRVEVGELVGVTVEELDGAGSGFEITSLDRSVCSVIRLDKDPPLSVASIQVSAVGTCTLQISQEPDRRFKGVVDVKQFDTIA